MNRYNRGFTIVELLVVIVVIGILAVVAVVAYNGISDRAVNAGQKADASNAAKILENDKTSSSEGLYPSSDDAANGGKGFPSSNGNTFTYIPNNSVYPPTYTLTVSNSRSDNVYEVTESNNIPTLLTGSAPAITLQPVSWINYTHTFTAAASGDPTPTVQWQKSSDNTTWNNVSGATNTSYATVPGDSVPCDYTYFRAIFTNSYGTATTNSAYVTAPCGD